MRFYLDSKKFFMRDELNQSFLLMSLVTNETFDLPAAWRPLLKYTDRWTDFDQFLRMLMFFSFGSGAVTREHAEKVIFSLHAAGIVSIEDFADTGATGARVAALRDYAALGQFCTENYAKGLSCAVSSSPAYYSATSFFRRMEQGKQQAVVLEETGKIKAALLCGPSVNFLGGTVFTLQSFVFDQAMNEAQCSEAIAALTGVICSEAEKKLHKLRYECTHERQSFIVNRLEKLGFTKTATLPGEIEGKLDLVLYDKML